MNTLGWMDWSLARDLALRATVWLAVVLVAGRAVGRRRPLLGSALGHAGLLGLLILPVAVRFGPPLAVPLLAAPAVVAGPTVGPEASLPRGDAFALPAVRPDATPRPGPIIGAAPSVVPPVVIPSPLASVTRAPIGVGAILEGIYALVALVLLARLGGSLGAVGRLVRSGAVVDDPAWRDALDRLRRRLGIARPVGLVRSARVGVPVVVGWLRPTILLPAAGGGDPVEHAEAILLHELAHVRRGDYAWNILLRMVEAAYWPHPLAWLLGRAVAESRELACDAFCVHGLGGPASYKEALLAMAEGLARPGPALGLAMARPSRLARRVAALDWTAGSPRCLPARPTRLLVAALGLALAAALGPARITRAAPRPAPAPTPIIAQDPAPAPAGPRTFRLRVVAAATGRPVPRADVRLWLKMSNNDWRRTDDEGKLDILYNTGPDDRSFSLDVWGDGCAMQRLYWGNDPKVPIPAEATIKLQPGESLGGLVRDEAGRPVGGAVVYLWSHNYKRQDPAEILYDLRAVTGPDGRWHTGGAPTTTGDLLGYYVTHPDYLSERGYNTALPKPPIADFRAGTAIATMKQGVPITGRVLGTDGRPVAGALVISTEWSGHLFDDRSVVRSDADGRFRTGQVKPGAWHLIVRAPGHAPAARQVKVGAAAPDEEIRLAAARPFRARVVEPDGRPIAGAFVNVDTWQGYRCLGVYLYSDAAGQVRWDDAPADDLLVNVDCRGYAGISQRRVESGFDPTFNLQPAVEVSGMVRDAETKKRVARAVIETGIVDAGTGEVAIWRPVPELGPVSFYDGRLTTTIPVASDADASKIRITAEGYEPFVSRAFRRRDERVVRDYDVALVPGRPGGPLATAVRPNGRPLAGARIVRGRLNRNISLSDGQVDGESGGRQAVTAADGTFAIQREQEPGLVLILGDDCFAYANTTALAATPRLQARPYGRIEGRFLVGARPLANRPIDLTGLLQDDSTAYVSLFSSRKVTTDAEGRFVLDKLIPMADLRVARREDMDKPGAVSSIGEAVRVEDGQTTEATIGGTGRPVVGRVEPPTGWGRPVDFTDHGEASIQSDRPNCPYPPELFRGKTTLADGGWSRWSQAWAGTLAGRAHADARVAIRVPLAADGSFRIDDVPPGEYRVSIEVNEPARRRDRGPFATLTRTFAVPTIPGGRTDEPLDLGSMRLRARAGPKVGEPAPRFEVTTVDGIHRTVPDAYAGRYVLLDFGTIGEDQSRLQIARMNDVFARFGKDGRFALLSLLVAADRPDARAFVAGKDQPWPQAIVGPFANPIADAYGVEGDAYGVEGDAFPAALLIGPDGRIVARDLHYQAIGAAVAAALGIKEP